MLKRLGRNRIARGGAGRWLSVTQLAVALGTTAAGIRCAGPGPTSSRHCSRLMLLVSLSQTISALATAGQTRTMPSRPTVVRRFPSRLNATPCTPPECPVSAGPSCWPVSASPQSHRLTGAAGGQAMPIPGKRHCHHRVGVAGPEAAEVLELGGVGRPQLHCLVAPALARRWPSGPLNTTARTVPLGRTDRCRAGRPCRRSTAPPRRRRCPWPGDGHPG